MYYLGVQQAGTANTQSWCSYMASNLAKSTLDNQKQVILGPSRLQATWVCDTPLDSRIIETICEDLKRDAFAQAN